MESEPIGTENEDRQRELVRNHLAATMAHPFFKGRRVILTSFVEMDLSVNLAGTINTMIVGAVRGTFATMAGYTKRAGEVYPGVTSGDDNKPHMIHITKHVLANKDIKIWKHPICIGHRGGVGITPALRSASIVNLLREQLIAFQQRVRVPATVHSKAKITISGKRGNRQDDLGMSFLMCLYWAYVSIRTPSKIIIKRI